LSVGTPFTGVIGEFDWSRGASRRRKIKPNKPVEWKKKSISIETNE